MTAIKRHGLEIQAKLAELKRGINVKIIVFSTERDKVALHSDRTQECDSITWSSHSSYEKALVSQSRLAIVQDRDRAGIHSYTSWLLGIHVRAVLLLRTHIASAHVCSHPETRICCTCSLTLSIAILGREGMRLQYMYSTFCIDWCWSTHWWEINTHVLDESVTVILPAWFPAHCSVFQPSDLQ